MMGNDAVEFSIIGLDSLLGKFDAVSYDVRRKGGRSSLRKAAQMLVGFAQENALELDDAETGRSIASNIDLRWNGKLFKQSGDLGFRVGVMQGAVLSKRGEQVDTAAGSKTPHWRLKEFGTENMPAQPFMRRALADHINEITNEFVNQYDAALGRAIKRAAKKAVQL